MAFGDFTPFCETAALPLCASVGHITSISNGVGIEANCYARNIELANTIIFQMAASAIHIVALVMTVVMIFHVRGKFTAVGTLIATYLATSCGDTALLPLFAKLKL